MSASYSHPALAGLGTGRCLEDLKHLKSVLITEI